MSKPVDVKKPIIHDVRNRIKLRASRARVIRCSLPLGSHWLSLPTLELVTKIGWPNAQPWAWSLWREGMLLGLRTRK